MTPCAPGSYQPNPGQASCLLADAGSFVALLPPEVLEPGGSHTVDVGVFAEGVVTDLDTG